MQKNSTPYERALAVLIPVYNPPGGWAKRLASRFQELSTDLEDVPSLCLVNDGTERSMFERGFRALSRQIPSVEVIHLSQNQGKGAAIRAGLKHLKARQVLITDVDMPFSLASYGAVIRALSRGADVVFTRRPQAYLQDLPCLRRSMSVGFARLTGMLTGKYAQGDVQAGLKGLSPAGAQRYLQTTVPGYLADFEFALMLDSSLQIKAVEAKMAQHHTQNLPLWLLFREMGFLVRILARMVFFRKTFSDAHDAPGPSS